MAIISLTDLLALVRDQGAWKRSGAEPPESALSISVAGDCQASDQEPVFNQDLAGQTLTYEGRDVTLVLDFDDRGYLIGLEFV